MNAASITFIGGEDAGNVGFTTMGPPGKTEVKFKLNEAVVLDPSKAKNDPERQMMEQIITKAKMNRFFKVEDVGAKKSDQRVEIPADWMDLHHQTKIKLARELGAGDEVSTQKQAEDFIAAELVSRKA